MADIKAIFKLPPEKAIKYFQGKTKNKLTWDWHELWQGAHKKTFTVAKAMREDILKDIKTAVNDAIIEGKTFEEFKKELEPTLKKKGWWGEVMVGDSQGNIEKAQLGSLYRLKTIYQVNTQVAYQTGRYQTQIENIDNRPFWQYVSVLDQKTRPEHAELNGKVFRYDDPFWSAFYPPNGWRCRCRVRALSTENVKERKLYIDNSKNCLSEQTVLVSKKRIGGREWRRGEAEQTRLTPPSKQSGLKTQNTIYTDPLTNRKVTPDVGWDYCVGKV